MMTIEEFGRRFRTGEVTSTQVTEERLRRIDADNARLNAFTLVMADEALRRAREVDKEFAAGTDRGPLHGVPISIKDIIDIRGLPTTASSRVREGHVAERDAPVIAHLRQAGAVLIGKTNLHEFAFGTTSEDSAFGAVKNPRDASRSAGGSSGGSGASVAAGMALASIGTDTGGSVRIPAAVCGTVGLKPTLGEVSIDGVVPLSRTMDHVGPLTASVADASLVYHALLGDTRTAPPVPMPMHGLRLAVPRTYFCDLLDNEVRARFEAAIERLRAAGAHIDEIEIRHATDIAPVYLHIVLSDAAAYHAHTLETVPDRYTPPVRLRLEMGRYVMAEDYVRALAGRDVLAREVDAALAQHDALMLPTLSIVAPPIGAATVEVGSAREPVRNVMLRLTQLFNVTGHPAVSIPAAPLDSAHDDDTRLARPISAALPCGVQLVGCRHQTDALLKVALACEPQITGISVPRGGTVGG